MLFLDNQNQYNKNKENGNYFPSKIYTYIFYSFFKNKM